MLRNVARFSILGLIAILVLAATTGCFFGGGEEPEPTSTPDLAATIAAAVEAAVPTATPIPPTDTPEPPTPEPTPDLQATIDASIAATRAAMPTNTPEPTPTPTPVPTNTPEPTSTPVPTPVPTATPVSNPASRIPCMIAGVVRDSGGPVANALVVAMSKDGSNRVVADTRSDAEGTYRLPITEFDQFFDIFIGADDTGVDTPRTSPGCVVRRDLRVN